MRETFWEIVCDSLPLFGILFAVDVVLFVFLLVSFPFVDDPATRVAGLLAAAVLVVTLAGVGYVIRRCRTRGRE